MHRHATALPRLPYIYKDVEVTHDPSFPGVIYPQHILPARQARLELREPGQYSEMVLEMGLETSELQPKHPSSGMGLPLLNKHKHIAPFFPLF